MNIDNILQDFLSEIEKINNLKNLEILQIKYLGRNGKVNQLINQLKLIPVSQKKEFGIKLNNLKKEILEKIDDKKNLLLKKQEEEIIDITLPGKKYPKGSLHPT